MRQQRIPRSARTHGQAKKKDTVSGHVVRIGLGSYVGESFRTRKLRTRTHMRKSRDFGAGAKRGPPRRATLRLRNNIGNCCAYSAGSPNRRPSVSKSGQLEATNDSSPCGPWQVLIHDVLASQCRMKQNIRANPFRLQDLVLNKSSRPFAMSASGQTKVHRSQALERRKRIRLGGRPSPSNQGVGSPRLFLHLRARSMCQPGGARFVCVPV